MSPVPNTIPSYGQKAGALIFSGTIAAAAGALNPVMPSVKPEIERPADHRLYSGSPFPKPVAIAEGVKSGQTYKAMPDHVTRSELNANLATIEAKMDGRLARIEDRFTSIDRQFSDIRSILAEQKNTAWKAAGAVIATFVAVFAIYVTSFDSGRDTARLAADAQTKAAQAQAETAAALSEIRQIVSEMKTQAQ